MSTPGAPASQLFVIATPIGNLGDLSARAIETLRSCPIVLAEDTRMARKLLERFEIRAELKSCHKHNEHRVREELEVLFARHSNIALVSDAGTPNVSDPGKVLLRQAWELGARITPIPGPSAVTAVLSLVADGEDSFCFHGFLPRKKSEREDWFELWRSMGGTHVFFVPPHGLAEALADLAGEFAGSALYIGREMTKIHETCVRAVLPDLPEVTIKGECTMALVIKEHQAKREHLEMRHLSTRDHLLTLMHFHEMSKKDAIAEVASMRGVSKKDVYKISLSLPD